MINVHDKIATLETVVLSLSQGVYNGEKICLKYSCDNAKYGLEVHCIKYHINFYTITFFTS